MNEQSVLPAYQRCNEKKDFWKSSGNILLKISYKKKACNTWILENLHEKRMKNCYPIFSIWVTTEIKKMYHQRIENSEILTTPDYTRFFIRICFIRIYMWISKCSARCSVHALFIRKLIVLLLAFFYKKVFERKMIIV